MRKRTTRKRSGNLGSIAAISFGLILFAFAALAAEKPKRKTNKNPVEAATVAGTVFRDAGFALPGAEIIAAPDPPEGKKQWKTAGDARGEYVLRLPAGPASYNVLVRAKGYRSQEKKVTFAADERLDLNFLLQSDGDNAK
jgi:hypothetical protein